MHHPIARAAMVLGALALPVAARAAGTLPQGYRYHRVLRFTRARARGAPGPDEAWASFYTNQARRPHGRDLRVTNGLRIVMPMRVLRAMPGDDRTTIVFATMGPGPFNVWWGNANAPPRKTPLKLQRGVCMRVYPWPGGPTSSAREMQHELAAAGPPLAGRVLKQIFVGFDPLGSSRGDCIRYDALLHITQPGHYVFAFDVDDAGFVKLNGKTLLRKTVGGGMDGHVRFKKRINLKAGWYPLTAEQINFAGPTGIALDWRMPGHRRYAPVPPPAYAPIAHARAGPLQEIGKVYVADFHCHPTAETFVPPRFYFTRYVLEARVPGTFAPTVTWNLGDGQHAHGLRISHEYILPGHYTVKMTVQNAGRTFSATRRIYVPFRPYSLFPRPPRDTARSIGKVLSTYNFHTLSAAALRRGMLFFRGYHSPKQRIRWGLAWAAAKGTEAPHVVWHDGQALARFCIQQRQPLKAAQAYRLLAKRPLPAWLRAKCYAAYTRALCNFTNENRALLPRLSAWRKAISGHAPAARHTMYVAMAYAAVAAGDGKLADGYIKKAGVTGSVQANWQAIRQGVLARNVENYIHYDHIDTAANLLDRWESRYPSSLALGYTRLLRMKLLEALGHQLAAARIARQYVRAYSRSFYADHLLFKAYKDLLAAHQQQKASAVAAKLKKKYPESPYARKI